jgi:hypothetical protein
MGAPRPALRARLILDTGALIALERGERGAFEQLRVMGRRGYLAVVPTMVVMEAIAGTRNSQRLLQVLKVIGNELPLAPAISHQVPGLRRRAGVGSDADAIVVLEALTIPGSAILTDDREDILALLAAAGAQGVVPVFWISPASR